jgi:hypothetical protein
MPTGSFPVGNVLQFSSQSFVLYGGNPIQFSLTYPVGYTGSAPREFTPTGSGGGTVVTSSAPTIGQLFPRGY